MLPQSDKFNKGQKAYNDGDYIQACQLLMPFARQGYAEAQCMIATMYHCALGIEANGQEAVRWYLEAAKQGNPVACNNLATLYFTGMPDIPPDLDESNKWRHTAVLNGFSM